MRKRYALFFVVTLASSLAMAQGDTCTTALPVVTGIHLANGPSTGNGSGGANCGGGQNGDWYVYTPNFTGTITITSCHPLNNQQDDDTYLKVLTGACGALDCIGYNDDVGSAGCPGYSFASFLEVDVTAGENYFILWTDVFDSGPFYWELNECMGTVTGVTYDDNNDNATRDAGEGQVDVMLLVQPGNQYVSSGSDPYSFCSELGSYTISVPNPPLYHVPVPATRSFTIAAQGDQVVGADFAFQSTPGIYDASVSLFGWNPWIGNNTTVNVHYANVGTETVNATVTLTLDPLTSYVSSTPTASSTSGQTITWSLGALAEGAAGNIQVTILTATTAAPNAPVLHSASISTTETDINALNNSDTLPGICTTSFDPNDKQVGKAQITPQEVVDQEKLEYTVRFQNTGNAPAVNVVIRDILDADLDLSTFEMVGATHAYSLSILDGEAVWTFQDIMLPDSTTDLLGSQGAIHYKVAPRSNLILGDVISNRADIYFDYNEPVLTNTVETVIALSTGLDEEMLANAFTIHPSPSTGLVTVRWTAGEIDRASILIMDATGRTVRTFSALNNELRNGMTVDLSDLAKGAYVAWMQADGTEAHTRFVIQR